LCGRKERINHTRSLALQGAEQQQHHCCDQQCLFRAVPQESSSSVRVVGGFISDGADEFLLAQGLEQQPHLFHHCRRVLWSPSGAGRAVSLNSLSGLPASRHLMCGWQGTLGQPAHRDCRGHVHRTRAALQTVGLQHTSTSFSSFSHVFAQAPHGQLDRTRGGRRSCTADPTD
jgi:hypothetical protein